MPIYEYACKECNVSFEKVLRIAQMKEPLAEPCPACNATDSLEQCVTRASIGDPIKLGIKRPDQGWNEVLGKVKQAHPKGNWSNSRFSPSGIV